MWARNVFGNSLPYNDIYIADGFLPGNENVAVTCMTQRLDAVKKIAANYSIYFGLDVYRNGADSSAYIDTFIHELTHVWQGHNEGIVFFNYMVRALAAQARAIISHLDRNMAYEYDPNNYLKWSEYNPEQQASIVGQWFSWKPARVKNAGSMSSHDPRYTYIEKVYQSR